MSTLFGIHREGKKIKLIDDDLPEEYHIDSERKKEEFITVASRGNSGWIYWITDVAYYLDDNLLVYPLDNTAQGIYTIGDLKKEFNEQNKR